MSFIFNTSVNNLNSRMPILKFDHMNQNQGRTFGPLLGLFLVNLLAKSVAAKYYSYFPFNLPYGPNTPWLSYNKPLPTYNHYHGQWYPIKNPYVSSYENYPVLTTAAPLLTGEVPIDYHSDYQEYDEDVYYPENQDVLIPAESTNIHQKVIKKSTKEEIVQKVETTTPEVNQTTVDVPETTTVFMTSELPTTEEPIAEGSSFNVRRRPTQRRRGPSRRDKYPQRRRRTTTPPPFYYDSYEDYVEPNRRRRPPYQSAESYYDDDYGSFESTTRYFKKQKRRPTRKTHKNQNRDDSFEIETNTDRVNSNTEIVIVRQAAPSTTTAATTTTPGGTTTEPTTIITNSTIASTTPNSNETYGYGPSNGNEQVSFTYGPPVGKYHYQVPYIDWYAQEATSNAIVKRVRDIVDRKIKVK